VKNYWKVEEDEKNRIGNDERQKIKSVVTQVMLSSEPQIRRQLGEAIKLICKEDFPAKWKDFLPGIVKRLNTNDPGVIYTILEVIANVVYRYRHEGVSNRLWAEVKFVCETFMKPLLGLLKNLTGLIPKNQQNGQVLEQIFMCLDQICQIFYSMTAQDIYSFVQDNMDGFFTPFLNLLGYKNELLAPDMEDEAGLLEKTQAGVIDIARMYTDKYDEDFNPAWVSKFVSSTWSLLIKTNESGRYDQLVPTAIKFLTSVVEKEWHKKNFGNPKAIKDFTEKVIIPQLKLKPGDMENFQSNGLEYVRRDMEGSDVDTRRRTTINFVRGLCKYFEKEVTQILKSYVESLLKQYQSDQAKNWMQKDVAMYISMALAIRGSTRMKGATKLNEFFDVMGFFKSQVLPELKSQSSHPVLKADSLKFIVTFRSQLPLEAYKSLIELIAQHLKHDSYVVHTYAAACIERILAVKDNGKTRFNKAHFKPYIKPILPLLFNIFEKRGSEENEYAMKAIFRVCTVGEEHLAQVAATVIQSITGILSKVAKNPRMPNFNHYLFETLACLVKNICNAHPKAIATFEKALFPPFNTMLGMETCREFGPYVFQILAQLLEMHKELTQPFKNIFASLLHPAMWAEKGNIPAMIRLLVAYLRVDYRVVGEKLEGLLGIFQKLLAKKRDDHFGMALISAIVEKIPIKLWKQYAKAFIQMMFMRLKNSATPKFTRNFVSFAGFFCHKHGADSFVEICEEVNKGIFSNLLQKILIPNIEKVDGKTERKSCAVGMTDLLCKSKTMVSGDYPRIWPQLLKAIINLFEIPEQTYTLEEDIMDISERGFKTAYCRLAASAEKKYDPLADVPNVKQYLALSLSQLSQQYPGKIKAAIGKGLPADHQGALKRYLSQANATIA